MTTVEELTPALEEAWDAFLLTQPDSLLYHSIGYRDLLVRHLGCEARYLVATEGGEIRGTLPLMCASAEGGRVWNSLPYYGSNGGVLAASAAARDALLGAYREIATAPGTIASTVSANPFLDDGGAVPVHTHTDRRISQQTPLEPGADLLERCESSARRNVRKALRAGVTVERDPGAMGDLARIHRDNIRSIGGLAKEVSFFHDVEALFEPGRHYDLWVGRHEGAVAAALLVFYWNTTAEYFTPAVEHDARPLQPLAPVLAEAMAHAAERGMTRWNWGGTWETQSGVFRFKRKWGAEARPYTYYVQVNDRTVLRWPRERFAERFQHFFVVPFSALEPEGDAA